MNREPINQREQTYIQQAYYNSSLGILRMDYKNNCLYRLQAVAQVDGEGEHTGFTDKVYAQILEYLEGKRKQFDGISYQLSGTVFQQKVWRVLEEIPYGETRTYGEIAQIVGCPGASRAVGGACNKNPIWLLIPCHRVIGKNGKLTGYAGGLEMKEKLLQIEGVKSFP